MNSLNFTIELLEPMLCVGLEGDPNAGVSLNYIPGSVLRGAIIGKFREIDAARDRDFFDSSLLFLNSYPEVDSKRSLPVPLSWHKEKESEETVGDSFKDFAFCEPESLKNPKTLGTKFFGLKNSSTIYKAEIKTRLAIHTQRDSAKGRSTSQNGAVYRYESVVKGTKFIGSIIGDEEKLNQIVKKIPTNTEIFIGGSRTAGYGKAKIIAIEESKNYSETTINNCWEQNNEVEFPYRFTVTLLSDALIRNKNGFYQTNISDEFTEFGVLDDEKTFKKLDVIGGFNRKWGLPLPQTYSIKAGSVFTFKAKQEIQSSEFQTLVDYGIGERRLDGFGRIAINLCRNDEEFSFAEPSKVHRNVELKSTDLAKNILVKIIRQRMDEKLLNTVPNHAETSKKINQKISNSQISRFRLVIREVLSDDNKNIKPIADFFSDANLKKTARDQFESVRVTYGENNGNLKYWIIESLTKKNLFAKDLELSLGSKPAETQVNNHGDKLLIEYHLRLIDSILKNAAKENKK